MGRSGGLAVRVGEKELGGRESFAKGLVPVEKDEVLSNEGHYKKHEKYIESATC